MKFKIKKHIIIPTTTTIISLPTLIAVACAPNQHQQQDSEQNKERQAKTNAINSVLEKVNLYYNQPQFYLEQKAQFDLLKKKKHLTALDLENFYNKLLQKLFKLDSDDILAKLNKIAQLQTSVEKLQNEIKNLPKSNQTTSDDQKNSNIQQPTISQNQQGDSTTTQLTIKEQKIQELQKQIGALKKNFLPRTISGKHGYNRLLEIESQYLNKLLSILQSLDQTPASIISQVNTLSSFVERKIKIEDSITETVKDLDKYQNVVLSEIKRFNLLKNAFDGIILGFNKTINIDDESEPFMNLLFEWRIADLQGLKNAVSNAQASSFGSDASKQEQTKTSLIAELDKILSAYQNAKTNSKNFLEQLINYNNVESGYWDKFIENKNSKVTAEGVSVDTTIWHVKYVISKFPLSTRITDEQFIKEVKPITSKIFDEYKKYYQSLGKNFDSVFYRKLNKPFFDIVYNLTKFQYLTIENTKHGFLGLFQDYENQLKTKFTLTTQKMQEDKTKVVEKNNKIKTEIDAAITKLNNMKSTDSSTDTVKNQKIEQLVSRFNTEYNSVKDDDESDILKAFNKYLKLRMLQEKLKFLEQSFLYWEKLGLDPHSSELETLLGYTKDNGKYQTQINDAKANVAKYTKNKEKVTQWLSKIPSDYASDETVSNKKQYIATNTNALKEMLDMVATSIAENGEFNSDDQIKTELAKFSPELKNKLNELQTGSISDTDFNAKFNELKTLLTTTKNALNTVTSKLDEYITDENSSITTFQNKIQKAQKLSYYVPAQELLASIREWNINDLSKWTNNLSLSKSNPDTEAYNTTSAVVSNLVKTEKNIAITNFNDKDISSANESTTLDKEAYKKEFLELEKAYFEASQAALDAIDTNANDVDVKKTALKQARDAYYAKLNNSNVIIEKGSFLKYNNSIYQENNDGNTSSFTPYDLANIYATFKASEKVLKELIDEYL
ncbi:hypothetical protein BCF59_0636 [Mycoplasmopsis mustelae]|uniref:Lipoprotein n=1 Tax=Mycoplasmopsis mustelae TaxID=171289 RepID=A0A4R7UDH4_9BACT|nr:hypothetical protein [Mycoplasmopsis mustelae]TDV23290.1 hypothetical protein BCF59_0636 [Mycoplasmopsis mustelae]